jgi:hypothetical protein
VIAQSRTIALLGAVIVDDAVAANLIVARRIAAIKTSGIAVIALLDRLANTVSAILILASGAAAIVADAVAVVALLARLDDAVAAILARLRGGHASGGRVHGAWRGSGDAYTTGAGLGSVAPISVVAIRIKRALVDTRICRSPHPENDRG